MPVQHVLAKMYRFKFFPPVFFFDVFVVIWGKNKRINYWGQSLMVPYGHGGVKST